MLGLETLYSVRKHLESDDGKYDAEVLSELLKEVYHLDSYQEWLGNGQFYSSSDRRSRYYVEPAFGKGWSDKKWLLEKLGLLNGDMLTAKVDVHEDRIHITDGSWVPAEFRVFPFVDESSDIVEFVRRSGFEEQSDVLIDPACGCGHHALGLADISQKINFDINPRALEFAKINCILANVGSMYCSENDIRRGLPDHLSLIGDGRFLITANMPFAIFPKMSDTANGPSPAQDGGQRGMELTAHVVRAVAQFKKRSNARSIRAVILCYSLGNPEEGKWEIEQIAEEYLNEYETSFHVLDNEKMWRVNGRKDQSNPMSLTNLSLKASCKHTYRAEQMSEANEGYEKLISLYKEDGWSHLGYGLLVVN